MVLVREKKEKKKNHVCTLSCPDHDCFWLLILYSLRSVRTQ